MSNKFQIGALCIPTPFFIDYWVGYWIIVAMETDEDMNISYVTLYNLVNARQVTIPMHDIATYFVVVSERWLK